MLVLHTHPIRFVGRGRVQPLRASARYQRSIRATASIGDHPRRSRPSSSARRADY